MNLRDQNNPAVLNAIKEIVQKNRQDAVQEEQKISEAAASKYASFKPKSIQEALTKKQKKLDKDHNGKLDAEDFKLLRKEEEEKPEESIEEARFKKGEDVGAPGKNFAKIAKKAAKKYGSKEAGARVAGAIEKKVLAKEATEKNTDTPGQSHQCALHVKHSQLGEGKTLFSQHAEPDAQGQIAWYDVMFEHGIEKKVPTTDLEVLVSEAHGNHKKK